MAVVFSLYKKVNLISKIERTYHKSHKNRISRNAEKPKPIE